MSIPTQDITDFRAFEATPGISAIMLPDSPSYTYVAVSNDFLHASGMRKEDVIGKGHFDIYPKNPGDPNFTGEKNLRSSFEYVVEHKKPHEIYRQRYDVPNGDGTFSQKYWKIKNVPILSPTGRVQFIVHSATDVTGQALAEQKAELSKGMEKAYHFFINAPVIIGFVKGADYVIELANEGLLEVWGRTPEVIGKPLMEAIPELEGQGFKALLDLVCETGEPFYAYEHPITLNRYGKDEVRYFDFVYKPFYENGTDSRASGVFSVGHDVTAQVLARRKIEESEAKYHSLFDSMDQGFCMLELLFDTEKKPIDYRFLEVNPVFEKQTGLKDVVGKTALELIPNLEKHWLDRYGNVALTGEPVRFTEESHALGRWFEVYAYRNGGPESSKVALLFTDITQRKHSEQAIRESEERFRHLADDSPMFVFIIDAGSTAPVSYWNKTWLQYTGQSLEEAVGRAWDGIIHPDDIAVVMEHYTPAYQNRHSYFIPAVRVKRYDGMYRWHAFKGNPRYAPNYDFLGYIGVGFDIHEQKLAEEALKESEVQLQRKITERTIELERTINELKRSNTNLEEFAHAASHDLKEPIRKITFFTDQLKDQLSGHLQESEIRSFGRIESAAQRMANLIDDLLLYSHVSQRPHEMELIDLNQKVQRVLEDLELDIKEKNAVIHVGKLPVVAGYRRQLQQLFQNLISNALKYCKAGVPPYIDITATTVKENEKQYAVIWIKDNGIGFEQEYADKIFQMFTRLHGKSEYSGTGVGLSIVKKVVENHNGFIKVKSEPGQGATFTVYLPAD